MSLPEVLQDYCRRAAGLREELQQSRLTVAEDQPAEDGVVLTDRFADAVDDALGCLEEVLANGLEARRTAIERGGLDHVRQALSASHVAWLRLRRLYLQELTSYERLNELTRFARKRGREWMAWARAVRSALEQHRDAIDGIDTALLHSWEELAEHADRKSISVHATSIGQQIRTPEVAFAAGEPGG